MAVARSWRWQPSSPQVLRERKTLLRPAYHEPRVLLLRPSSVLHQIEVNRTVEALAVSTSDTEGDAGRWDVCCLVDGDERCHEGCSLLRRALQDGDSSYHSRNPGCCSCAI